MIEGEGGHAHADCSGCPMFDYKHDTCLIGRISPNSKSGERPSLASSGGKRKRCKNNRAIPEGPLQSSKESASP